MCTVRFKAWQYYDVVWDYNWFILPTFWNVQKRFVTGALSKTSDNQGQREAVSWSKWLLCRNVIGCLCHFMRVTGQLEVFSSTLHHSSFVSVPDITVLLVLCRLVVLSLGSQTGLRSSVTSLLSCFITINNLIPTKNRIYCFYWEKVTFPKNKQMWNHDWNPQKLHNLIINT